MGWGFGIFAFYIFWHPQDIKILPRKEWGIGKSFDFAQDFAQNDMIRFDMQRLNIIGH